MWVCCLGVLLSFDLCYFDCFWLEVRCLLVCCDAVGFVLENCFCGFGGVWGVWVCGFGVLWWVVPRYAVWCLFLSCFWFDGCFVATVCGCVKIACLLFVFWFDLGVFFCFS